MALAALPKLTALRPLGGRLGGLVVRWAWTAPSMDCYAALGVSSMATAAEIREAYLSRAKQLHPDVAGTGSVASSKMAQLNLSYEALTRHRQEYDASRGVGGMGSRASAYSASSSRDPWWRRASEFEEEFQEMGKAWAEAQQRFHGRPNGDGRRTWNQWAEEWRSESGPRRGASGNRRRRPRGWQVYESSSDDSDTESEWEEEYGGRRAGPRRHWKEASEQGHQSRGSRSRPSTEPPPAQFFLSVMQRVKPGAPHPPDPLAGAYHRLEEDFCGRSAYCREASPGFPALYLFWSQSYGDWKLAERLEEEASCVAFAADERGASWPWQPGRLRWRVWEPLQRRFVPRRLQCEELGENSETAGPEESQSSRGPKHRKPIVEWSTQQLLRFCEERSISTEGCFDRDSLLERVLIAFAEEEEASASENGRQRAGSAGASTVRLASRVKTDGSYTRPPSLDRRVSIYGNRVECFRGPDLEVLPWLQEFGDKSRLYGVFSKGAFCYSLVWRTRQRLWGRLENRASGRREAW